MKKLSEEEQLQNITSDFSEGVKLFSKKDYAKSLESFERIIKAYEETEYYSVEEILNRSQVYRNICNAQLDPVTIALNEDQDYLDHGIIELNAGNYEAACKYFDDLENRGYKDPFLYYLRSVAYYKMENIESSLENLTKCVQGDEKFKIIAFNEPDFTGFFENEEFRSIIE